MNITVTHTLAPEILALLQGFTATQKTVDTLASNEQVKDLAAVKPAKKEKNLTVVKAETTSPEIDSNEITDSTKGNAQDEKITVEQVREAVVAASQAGKRDGVKALLTELGVANVTKLESKDFAQFLTAVKAL